VVFDFLNIHGVLQKSKTLKLVLYFYMLRLSKCVSSLTLSGGFRYCCVGGGGAQKFSRDTKFSNLEN